MELITTTDLKYFNKLNEYYVVETRQWFFLVGIVDEYDSHCFKYTFPKN